MNILLVEDDHDSRVSMARFITSLGHTLTEAENGVEALDILSSGANIHVVLSDIRMPVMGGHELLRRIKGDPAVRDIVAILFTAFKDINSAIEALRDGAYDYLLKPINPEELAALLDRIGEYLFLKEENVALTENFDREVKRATDEMKNELVELRRAYAREVGTSGIGIFSGTLRSVFDTADKLHRNRDIPVLIEGETGTGKEVVARYIHYGTGDATSPFVGLNCAAISPELFESELFGYEPGAFTGGKTEGQKGKIELALGGSLFLDEITQLGPDYQAKLLRVIQEREYYRVGGIRKFSADVRFICATNESIGEKVKNGSFRQDLYYRLNIGRVHIPPLRERRDEIVPLAEMFLSALREQKKSAFTAIGEEAAAVLRDYGWPGNVRELRNTMERISFLHEGAVVEPRHLDFLRHEHIAAVSQASAEDVRPTIDGAALPPHSFDLDTWILDIVAAALERHDGNKTDAARYLGISRRTLYTYLSHIESRGR